MRPNSKGTHMSWLLVENVTQDMRLTLRDRFKQLSIGLICYSSYAEGVIAIIQF